MEIEAWVDSCERPGWERHLDCFCEVLCPPKWVIGKKRGVRRQEHHFLASAEPRPLVQRCRMGGVHAVLQHQSPAHGIDGVHSVIGTKVHLLLRQLGRLLLGGAQESVRTPLGPHPHQTMLQLRLRSGSELMPARQRCISLGMLGYQGSCLPEIMCTCFWEANWSPALCSRQDSLYGLDWHFQV